MVPMTREETAKLLGELHLQKHEIDQKLVANEQRRENYLVHLERTTSALRQKSECRLDDESRPDLNGPDMFFYLSRTEGLIAVTVPTAEQIASVLIELRELNEALQKTEARIEKMGK